MVKSRILYFIIILTLILVQNLPNTYGESKSYPYIRSIESDSYCLDSEDNAWTWSYNKPEKLEGFTNVSSMSINNGTIMALKNDRTVWTRGSNDVGQLGNGKYLNSDIPVKVEGLSDVIKIANGSNHMVALKEDGTIWTWGDNFFGQLGAKVDNSNIPIQIFGIDDVIDIKAGHGTTIFLKKDGTVWVMGKGVAIPKGDGSSSSIALYFKPTKLQLLKDIKQISLSNEHLLALDSSGQLWEWGENSDGQLGNGNTLGVSEPFALQGQLDIKDIVAGASFSAVLKNDGSVYVWGRNVFEGKWDEIIDSPKTFPSMSDISNIEGWSGLIAQKRDGSLWTWSYETRGPLNGINSGDVSLRNITINKMPLQNFSTDKNIYNVVLPASAKQIPSVDVSLSNPQAHINVQYPNKIPGSVRITVDAQNQKKTENYYINFTRANDKTSPVYVDGIILNTYLTLDIKNTLLVPIYDIYYLLGINYNNDNKAVNIKSGYNDINITLKESDTNAVVNGKIVKLNVAPVKRNGVFFVPLRFIVENTGNKIQWDNISKSIQISTLSAERQRFFDTSDIELVVDKEIINVGEETKANVVLGMQPELSKDKVSYSSSDEKVLTVDNEGNIKANKEGRAYVNASYIGKNKSVMVYVLANDTKTINSKNELRQLIIDSAIEYKDEMHVLLNKRFNVDEDTVQSVSSEIGSGIYEYYFRHAFTPSYNKINVTDGEYVYANLKFLYKMSLQEKEAVDLKANSIINEIIKPNMNDYDKVKAVHDYVVLNTAYDYENYINDTIPDESGSPYGVLIKGTGVCGGYASTIKLLLSKLDIECYYVVGTAYGSKKRYEDHAWNIVKVNGTYYNLDSTWDDPVPDRKGTIGYKYFLVSDKVMSEQHQWDRDRYPSCSSNY